MKNRLPGPSEICALELKGEFRRSEFARFQRLSASIGRFLKSAARAVLSAWQKKDRQQSCPGTLRSFSPAVAGSHSVPADRVQTIGARAVSAEINSRHRSVWIRCVV